MGLVPPQPPPSRYRPPTTLNQGPPIVDPPTKDGYAKQRAGVERGVRVARHWEAVRDTWPYNQLWTCPECAAQWTVTDAARVHINQQDGKGRPLRAFSQCPEPDCGHYAIAERPREPGALARLFKALRGVDPPYDGVKYPPIPPRTEPADPFVRHALPGDPFIPEGEDDPTPPQPRADGRPIMRMPAPMPGTHSEPNQPTADPAFLPTLRAFVGAWLRAVFAVDERQRPGRQPIGKVNPQPPRPTPPAPQLRATMHCRGCGKSQIHTIDAARGIMVCTICRHARQMA